MLAPRTQINLPGWMTSGEARAVMAALSTGQEDVAALFVGGCVRNAVIGRAVTDIDIATTLTPKETISALEAAGIKVIPTGIDHGTVTAIAGDKPFEITTLRRDVETDGRRAVVAYTKNWKEDAERRDFTMNTLLADWEGHIYDPLGQGWNDLQARRVVFVGDPAERIREDYLRILRFFRFHGSYGAGVPDPSALAACRKETDKIVTLSRERITQEFMRILAFDEPVDTLALMFENNVLADLPAAGYDEEVLAALCSLQIKYNAPDVIARLAVLGGFSGSWLERQERYLILSNSQKKNFSILIEMVSAIDDLNDDTIKRLIYRHGNSNTIQAVLLFMAWQDTENSTLIELARIWQAPVFPLSGEDIKQAGVKQGPEIGEMLTAVQEWWIGEDFKPDRKACLTRLSALLS